jgi:hypothetical protein
MIGNSKYSKKATRTVSACNAVATATAQQRTPIGQMTKMTATHKDPSDEKDDRNDHA